MAEAKTEVFELRRVVLYAALFLTLDGVCNFVPALQSPALSYAFQIAAPLLALAACFFRSRQAPPRSRALWVLLMAGLTIWSIAMMLSAWADLMQHIPYQTPSFADFAFFFYGVPILFAISTPVDGQRFPWFVWLDGIQAAFAGYLAYITIFSVLPLSTRPLHPISIGLLVFTYNVENAVLAVGCGLRMMTAPRWSGEWRFYRMLGIFLLVYAIGTAVYNHYAMILASHAPPDLLSTAPFIVLAVHASTLPRTRKKHEKPPGRRRPAELFIDNASPIFFTLALLTLGLVVFRTYFLTGIVAIAVALAVYCIRTTVLQTRYLETQYELKEARDRLEAISLEDGLTGIANRRCFNQRLELEWHRAARSRQPVALLIADLDLFKELNDTQGHPAGDRCLVQVAGVLHGLATRSADLVARYGGEEFAAILPGAGEEEALAMAERMRAAVSTLRIANATPLGPYMTVSIGVALCIPTNDGTSDSLVAAADRALYRAKALGRNRVELDAMAMPA